MKISATIITFNEESNIKAACESVAWADEIVVVDSESTDATREIAESCGARVITNPWPGFGAQKQFAVNRAAHDWIFYIDADERVTVRRERPVERARRHLTTEGRERRTEHQRIARDERHHHHRPRA